VISEDSLLERVTAAIFLQFTPRRLRIIAWAAAEGLVLETLPSERVGEFYEEATRFEFGAIRRREAERA
jgi:hypothetical protein